MPTHHTSHWPSHTPTTLARFARSHWWDVSIDEQFDSYPDQLKPLFHTQQDIGWEQIYYRQIAILWAQHFMYGSNYTTDSDMLYTKVTKHLWVYILDCWKLCNTALHTQQNTLVDAHVLAEQVHCLINTVCNVPGLAHVIPPQDPEQILKRPLHIIEGKCWPKESVKGSFTCWPSKVYPIGN